MGVQNLNCKYNSKDEFVSLVREILAEHGYLVESPKTLRGESGTTHKFDILAKSGNGSIIVEFLEPHLPDEAAVISLYAKIIDVRSILNLAKIFLVAMQKMSQAGKTLAKQYLFTVIEAWEKEAFTKDFKTHLTNL